MSPRPDTHDSTSSSVVMATAGSASASPPDEKATETQQSAVRKGAFEQLSGAVVENPYLAGLSKKTRGLKKKLEKIRKTESLSASGKHLNEEQLKLLESKPLLEVALAEHDKVRLAMETVAKDLQHDTEEQARLSAPSSALSILPVDPSPAALSIPAPGGNPDVTSAPEATVGPHTSVTSVTVPTEEVAAAAEQLQTQEGCAQTEVSGPPPPVGLDPEEVSKAVAAAAKIASEEKEKAVLEAEARGVAAGRAGVAGGVSKILKLLHVASRFEAKGERLPTAVDFFSKVLLGKTVPPDEADFDDCLLQSVERAVLYLDHSSSSKEVAPGVSFEKLDGMVSALRELIIAGPVAPQGPVFNFFGDASPPGGERGEAGSPKDEGAAVSRDSPVLQPVNGNIDPQPSVPPEVQRRAEAAPAFRPLPPPQDDGRQQQQPQPPPPQQQQQQQQQQGMVRAQSGPRVPPPSSMASSASTATSVHPSHGDTAEDREGVRSLPLARQVGRKASDIEEGMLPPVVDQHQPRHPPPASTDDTALAKQERRPNLRSRGPPPPHHTAPSGHHYVPQPRHPSMASPVLVHPPHVRSPFRQQPTPPLTPVQMGQGGLGPPRSALSPPALGPPMVGPPGGSPNMSHGGAWGYHQAPQQAPLIQHQQHPYGPPMHSTNGAPWGDPSPPMYPPPEQNNTQSGNGTGPSGAARNQAVLAGGFSLTPQHIQEVHMSPVHMSPVHMSPVHMSPVHMSPVHTSPMHMPSNAAPNQWAGAPPGTLPPPPPPHGPPPPLDLERGMNSPWQGASNGAGSVAPHGGEVENESEPATTGAAIDTFAVESPGAARQGFAGSERDESGNKHLAPADVVLDATPLQVTSQGTSQATSHATSQPSAAVTPPPETTSTLASNQAVTAPGTAAGTAPPPPKPRGGNNRGRGAGSRARGGRKAEARGMAGNTSTAGTGGGQPLSNQNQVSPADAEGVVALPAVAQRPAPHGQMQKLDTAQKNGRTQRRPRDQGRGQRQHQHQQPQKQEQAPAPTQAGQGGQGAMKVNAQNGAMAQTGRNQVQDDRRTAPPVKDRANPPPSQPSRQYQQHNGQVSASAQQNGWSSGHAAPQAASPSAVAPTRAPVSTSWADDEPSPPRAQQQQVRGGGGGRGRHSAQQKGASDVQRPNETKNRPQEAAREGLGFQNGRSNQRSRQGRGHASNGGNTTVAKPQTQQGQFAGRDANLARSGGGLPESQNRTDVRAKAPAEGSARVSNGNAGAQQGAGSRKNRPPPPNRRRLGGGGGGRGPPRQRGSA